MEPNPGGESQGTFLKIGAYAGALVAILGVLFIFFPGLQPKPDPEPEPPRELVADVSDVRVEPGAPPEVWRRTAARQRIGDETKLGPAQCAGKGAFDGTQVQSVGTHVNAVVELRGYYGRHACLRWTLYDAATRTPHSASTMRGQLGVEIAVGSQASRFDIPFGVPSPIDGGEFFIRVELTDVEGHRLAAEDSPAFTVTPGPSSL
jgi:hypothetical protein